jgi:hypothetical protein
VHIGGAFLFGSHYNIEPVYGQIVAACLLSQRLMGGRSRRHRWTRDGFGRSFFVVLARR